ncbi:MAG: hypothetical protein HS111_18115 [Kofleriaceae bacterium]|nr:hypothetical protein [Kofleriaceae bacterium]
MPWLDRALAGRLFEGMLTIRVTDARMMALQRQGPHRLLRRGHGPGRRR